MDKAHTRNDESNPVRTRRLALGLSIAEFAMMLDQQYAKVNAVERGFVRRLPKTWRQPMARVGLDYDEWNRELEEWCAKKAEALQDQVLKRRKEEQNASKTPNDAR